MRSGVPPPTATGPVDGLLDDQALVLFAELTSAPRSGDNRRQALFGRLSAQRS